MTCSPLPARITLLATIALVVMNGCGTTQESSTGTSSSSSSSSPHGQSASSVSWNFNGTKWTANGTPPACPNPLQIPTPVDLTKVTAVLYPGQFRGGNYKAHGGFIFGGSPNDAVTVTAPLDAIVYKASRYIEQGEVQYLFVFINPCGIMYRFDHLLTLSPQFQTLADTLPAPQENSSGTTNFTPPPSITAGDIVATAVGFKNTQSATVDFGVYDLRQQNAVSQTAAWQQAHSNPFDREGGAYGICWLNLFSPADVTTVKNLPGGDATNGTQSDYCS